MYASPKILLKCTPNDFYEWYPNNNLPVDENHPLNKIKTSNNEVNLTRMISNISLDKLADIEKLIAENINE